MSAAAARQALAAVGHDLVGSAGSAAERRGAALLASGNRREAPGASLSDLVHVPAWQRSPRSAQRRLAQLTAVLAMAPALATSIDGQRLGTLADMVGEDTLDWAIDQATEIPSPALNSVSTDQLEGRGFDMLRTRLPASLLAFSDWAPRTDEAPPVHLAAACATLAERHLAQA